MAQLYDIIISVMISGILLSMLIGFNGNITQEAVAQTIKMMAQSNLTTVTEIVDWDFRKMGYSLPASDSSIISAESTKIKFKGVFNSTGAPGTIDTLTYQLDTAASGNANKNTHMLFRKLNAQARQKMNMGITRLRFWYFDASGQPLAAPVSRPSLIKSMKIGMNIESTVPYKINTEKYVKNNPGGYWERSFKPKNLR